MSATVRCLLHREDHVLGGGVLVVVVAGDRLVVVGDAEAVDLASDRGGQLLGRLALEDLLPDDALTLRGVAGDAGDGTEGAGRGRLPALVAGRAVELLLRVAVDGDVLCGLGQDLFGCHVIPPGVNLYTFSGC